MKDKAYEWKNISIGYYHNCVQIVCKMKKQGVNPAFPFSAAPSCQAVFGFRVSYFRELRP